MAKINGVLSVSGTSNLNDIIVVGLATFQNSVIVPTPIDNDHAANKLYVDQLISGGLATKLNISGGALAGYLSLHAAPTSDFHAATKQYVDIKFAGGDGSSYIITNGVAGETIQGNRIVKIGPNGKFYKASSGAVGDGYSVVGMALNSALVDMPLQVTVSGIIEEPSWNFVTGQPAYLGLDGLITQTPPTSPTMKFQLSLGHFTFINKLYFTVGTPLFFEE